MTLRMRRILRLVGLCWGLPFAASALVSGSNAGTTAGRALSTSGAGSSGGTASAPSVAPDLFTGSASYGLPIEAPPGRHGLQPQIALLYRSTNGYGLLGPGFELELGAIERRTKGGVSFSNSDRSQAFVLRAPGTVADLAYDPGAAQYHVQFESDFARIRKLTAGDGNPYWEVTDKKGTKYLYGETAASRQSDPANATKIFRWSLDRVQDTNGNYMTVSYRTNGTHNEPLEIDYTGNTAGLSPTNSITFQYGAGRSDWSDVADYVPGFKEQWLDLLGSITVSAGGQTVRAYNLTYAGSAATGRYVLTGVTQVGKDLSTALPSVTCDWSSQRPAGAVIIAALVKYAPWNGKQTMRPADVNGDGYDDIVLGPDTNGAWFVMAGGPTGFHDLGQWVTGAHAGFATDSTAQSHIMVGDFNGDGKQDILVPDPGLNINNFPNNWYVERSEGDHFVEALWLSNSAYLNTWWGHPGRIHPVDVDGVGRTDVLLGPDSNGNWFLLYSQGSLFVERGIVAATGFSEPPLNAFPFATDSDAPVYYADVTGDGKTDIILGPDSNGTWYVMVNTSVASTATPPTPILSFAPPVVWATNKYTGADPARVAAVDINGDGKADLLMGPDGNGNWSMLTSTGASFVDMGIVLTGAYGGTDANRVRAVDLNYDGYTDILIGPSSSGQFFWVQNIGSRLVDQGAWMTYGGVNWDGFLSTGDIWPMDVATETVSSTWSPAPTTREIGSASPAPRRIPI
jgi:hypothetical protein